MKKNIKINKKMINNFASNIKDGVDKNKKEFIIDFIFIFLIYISCINGEYERSTIYVAALWSKEIYVNIRNRRNYIIVLFYLTIMFFIISRPLTALFLKYHWETYYSTNSSLFVLLSVSLSMIFINYGTMIYSGNKYKNKFEIKDKKKVEMENKKQSWKTKLIKGYSYKEIILMASSMLWIVCFFCQLIISLDKFMFVRKSNYVEYYVSYKNTFPLIMNVYSTIFGYIVLFILALKPKKILTMLVLASNILVSIPILLMGMRNGFLMSLVFTFIYLLYRYDIVREKMHSRKVIMWGCISILILGGFMGFLGNFRENKEAKSRNMIQAFLNFGYEQGTTFDTIRQAYYYSDKLPEHKSYTLGPIIDYLYYGKVGQILFNSIDLGDGNGILKGTQGNNLSHHLSYAVMKGKYIEGYGRGSSYIPELYLDFGYIGVCIGSLLLGLFLQIIHCNIFKNVGSTIVYLGALSNLWLVARASYTDTFQYLFTYHFWFAIFTVGILTFVIRLLVSTGSQFFRRRGYEN